MNTFKNLNSLALKKKDFLYVNHKKKSRIENKVCLKRSVKNYFRFKLYIYVYLLKRSTRITVINDEGLVLLTISVGMQFKKSNRKGVFAALRLFRLFIKKFKKLKYSYKFVLCVKGYGHGRRPLINLFNKGVFRKKSVTLVDLTSLPCNGCRKTKQRRL